MHIEKALFAVIIIYSTSGRMIGRDRWFGISNAVPTACLSSTACLYASDTIRRKRADQRLVKAAGFIDDDVRAFFPTPAGMPHTYALPLLRDGRRRTSPPIQFEALTAWRRRRIQQIMEKAYTNGMAAAATGKGEGEEKRENSAWAAPFTYHRRRRAAFV